jgi:aryl-alcohol dehydrogenase-like predicted oxidoreductase
MKFRAFGRTSARISVIGLGCGGFGGVGSERSLFGQGESESEAFALMDAAYAAGINYFDTANSYGGGRSEEMVGRWLQKRKVRDEIFLGTKVGTPLSDDPNDGGLSRRHILA